MHVVRSLQTNGEKLLQFTAFRRDSYV